MPRPVEESIIAIFSIGQMGLGIAKLLQAHKYHVITNVSDRSAATKARALSAGIQLYDTDEEVIREAEYFISIVPPLDAIATAERVRNAWAGSKRIGARKLYYLDLNAISPATAKKIAGIFEPPEYDVQVVDGGIIGGPPAPSKQDPSGWTRPGIPLSGPRSLENCGMLGWEVMKILNAKHIGPEIGTASGLKCCFAAISKGFTALALQSFTTASSLGVLEHLKEYMDLYNLNARQKAEKNIVGCTGKAYRWVEEMNQIGECFSTEGAWQDQACVFREIASLFQGLADVVEENGGQGMKNDEDVVEALGKKLHSKS
ncbi:MmsB 3-hydroxyisobutyrate dehydrogenase [Pyrenophora tritici-repentis]|uniref:6-phosphogluconate dehydrogenase C-terminal domain protein n=2 Tax=Pyrenophora tritici-repentis TaxID=45151 RepID=A0A2W1HIP6_9PLEO|nr:uncharacterized protein PTRG_07293 [Pyrenophora tritici-repentis Pt-1C-BFP]KAA8614873.1 6-phosphogluconate dehydrogenase C-terminal domain-like protein [Pyrenophora tritici-repentis]EDU50212.1 conserved hypothetical protein [Pyrenophora tritici-repentis Pt-1C-BFP]KAF7444695.1 6-phosphogluconate dehydrogenase C-terminal domain protein [Pyrenophora tritici-repentis]KAF7564642.1 DUF1932 multi-domain protein [Pyrenophora tritici-repentis]KAG9378937.1 6-phosphogluconate dehydrogenase C-terminal 